MFLERTYRCIVFDNNEQPCCERPIHAFSDLSAIERASWFLDRFQCGAGVRMELWRGSKLLHRERVANDRYPPSKSAG